MATMLMATRVIKYKIMRYNYIFWTIISVLFISFMAITFSLMIDFQRINNEFKQDVTQVDRQFIQQISSLEIVLTSLAGLHHASDDLNMAELTSFSEEMLNAYPFISTIISMEKVNAQDVALFEQRMQKLGFINLRLKGNADRKLDYLPINFIEPMTPLSASFLGLDIASLPDMPVVIKYAIETGDVSASNPIILKNSKTPVIIIFKSLYLGRYPPESEEERLAMFDGFVALKVNIAQFMNHLTMHDYNLTGELNSIVQKNSQHAHNEVFDFSWQHLLFIRVVDIYNKEYQFTLSRPISLQMINKVQMFSFWFITMLLLSHILFLLNKRKISEDKIKFLAYYDSLTHLPNRELFKKQLDNFFKNSHHKKSSNAILFMDLDDFKRINDTLGHDIGDALLVQVAERLQERMQQNNFASINCTKTHDCIARFGGDEFVLLLSDIKGVDAVKFIAERIQQCIAKPFILNGHKVYVTLSLGIVIFPEEGDNIECILKHADTAMHHAKTVGRNNYQFYSKQMSNKVEQRLLLEHKLHQALEHNELHLFYQPQIDVKTHKIVGAEALIRWQQRELGFIMPDEFIPMAEVSGQILKIGEWALEEACRQNKQWQTMGYDPIRIAVNLSGLQFMQDGLNTMVANILKKTQLNPKYLELEITETVMMNNVDEIVTKLKKLTDMNIEVSIDDFGTGYSSLSHLKKFPLKSLKIDKSFILDIPQNKDDMMITSAIISMAKDLGLNVVAEGVESKEQIDFLTEHQCDLMQGYYFSRPVPVAEFNTLLEKNSLE